MQRLLHELTVVRDELLVKLSKVKVRNKSEVIIVSRLTAIVSKNSDLSSSIVGMNLEKLK